MIPRYAPTYTYYDLVHSIGRCLQGKVDDNLRSRLAKLYSVKHVFLLNSARVAIYVLLKAYNQPGGVLMPAYNCIVVPEAVYYAGYYPVFVDINYHSLSMTPDALKKSISSDIKIISATHLFGIPCDVEEIMHLSQQYKVLIMEDAAPAVGAEFQGKLVASFGNAAVISFHSTKVISGENGGALLTNDDELAYKIDRFLQSAIIARGSWRLFAKAVARKIATSSWAYLTAQVGYRILHNEQMYEVVAPQTAIPPDFLKLSSRFPKWLVSMQLDRLDWNLGRRRKLAQIYQDRLSMQSGLVLPIIPENCSPSWIQFPIMVDDKMKFYKFMQRNGVDLSWSYRYSCADSFGIDGFPNAQRAARTVLGLPTYPSLSDQNAQRICDVAIKYSSDL